MDKKSPVYEGKAKIVYATDDPELFVLYFKDDATAFNAKKKAVIEKKGELNAKISARIFSYLQSHGIGSHFVKALSDREFLVKKVDIIPIELVIRNIAAGSLCKRLGIEEKKAICPPLVEYYYKRDDLDDPIFSPDHIFFMELCDRETLDRIRKQALKINDLLQSFFDERGITLVDFKLEFGLDSQGNVLLADEISPDGCRLWDKETQNIMDKDRFRKDLGDLIPAYEEVYRRIEGDIS
ncbi:MAG: phosphoribosylaminoimidazolesuccinocarboxamide synthase [Bdellovibrionales bacterium]|nr:phosphoribosylaminoimidazolesuccinocarboxamide synthase [Bdellovibrionales bacterium]